MIYLQRALLFIFSYTFSAIFYLQCSFLFPKKKKMLQFHEYEKCVDKLVPVTSFRVLKMYLLCFVFTPAVVSMFTLPVVYVKHQVSCTWSQTFMWNVDLTVFGCAHDFLLFLGTDWPISGTCEDSHKHCRGEVSSMVEFAERSHGLKQAREWIR